MNAPPTTEHTQSQDSTQSQHNFVRLMTLRFEKPNLGFSVVENENGVGLKVCNVTEKMSIVGLKENYSIVDLAGYDMRMSTLEHWQERIRRCRLPLRIRFKSLRLSKEEEIQYRQELEEKEKKRKLAPIPKRQRPPDPCCLYVGVTWFLIFFAVAVYISLMGLPFINSQAELGNGNGTLISSKLIHKDIWVDLEDIYLGRKVTFKPGRIQKICPHCSGTAAHHGNMDHTHTCEKCEGSGLVTERRELFLGFHTSSEKTCPSCTGRGYIVTDKCNHCHGKGYIMKDEAITIKLWKGMAEGREVYLMGKGHQVLGHTPGDIVLKVFSKRHRVFSRNGHDLLVDLRITLSEAFTGFEKTLTHLDGRKIPVSSTKVVNDKMRILIENEGMRTKSKMGNLNVRLKIIYPREMRSREVRKYRDRLRQEAGKPANFNYKIDKSEL